MVVVADAGSSIGKRLSLLVALCVFTATLVASLTIGLLQVSWRIHALNENYQAAAQMQIAALTTQTTTAAEDYQRSLAPLATLGSIETVAVLGPDGSVLSRIGQQAIDIHFGYVQDPGMWTMLSQTRIPYGYEISNGGQRRGFLVMQLNTIEVQNQVIYVAGLALAAALGAAALGSMIARAPVENVVQPLKALTDAMATVTQNRNYKATLEPSADDETGDLIGSYNAMLADIRSRDMALQKLAYYDPLTGLPNRPNFQQSIEEYIQQQKKAVIFLFDLDGFREINDALGHSIGDALLMEIAARLHGESNKETSIFRVGSDEFAIAVEGVETESRAQHELAKFLATLYHPLKLLAHEVHISAAVGGVLLPRDGSHSGEVMRHVELALGEAKKMGPGRLVFFRPSMDERIQASAELIMGLRQALQRDDFQVYYQPQVDIAEGKVDGFEALVRWKHASKGFISPALFIPVAERAGLVPEIGKRVMLQSCKQARQWFAQGLGMRQVSVNVSAAQMLQSDFLRQVQDALNESGLPPPLLCLELTESVFLGKSLGQIRHLLNDLKSMGLELALDDFGTGYSSLSYLEGLPFDKLKIDRSFVNGAHDNPRRQMLLQQIIDLAHGLGMKVVAEGAETQQDVDMLASMRSHYIQGFFYAKPEPADNAMAAALRIERTWSPLTSRVA